MVGDTNTAGGAAAAGGFEFQARAGAWFAAHILAERIAAHLFGLEPTDVLVSIRCEADAPVDDIIVETSARGFLFVQVKAGLRWSASRNAPLGKAIDQFVRQYLAGFTASEGRRPWERPLEVGRDRLLLVVTAESSRTVTIDFPSLLERVRSLPSDDELEQAVRTQSQGGLLSQLVGLVEDSWLSHMAERPPSGAVRDVLALIRVVPLDLGPERRDAASAASILADAVLRDSEQAATAWSTLVAICLAYSAERSGGGRAELQQALTQRGIRLRATPSYRGDIERLIRYSARLTDALRGLSEIRVGRVPLKIQRPVVTALRAAAEQGHCLVVGEAGAGKSGAVHDLVGVLREEGRDVIFLAVDRLAAEDEAGLRGALGLKHHLDEILANWPGTEPGFIVIDALDAARSDRSAKVVRELIRLIISAENRWLIVASIRKFDLRYSHETTNLFAGVPPNSFQDGEFSGVRHVDVPRLSDDELHQVGSQSSAVAEIVEAAPPRLQRLLQNPFNLRLIAELVGVGVVTAELMPIRTPDQLLSRYWGERVVREDRTGTERERVLSEITIGMITSRRLRVPRLSLPANLPGSALDDLLSHNVLAEWQPTPDSLPDRYVLTFAHHVLFDYAAARLVFQASGGPDVVATKLSDEPDLILMLRPSLEMYCRHLWERDPKRHAFWQAALKFQRAPNLRELTRLVAPSVAADRLFEMADLDGLLTILRREDAERRDAGAALFSHLVGAALAWPPHEQEEHLRVGPWCKLALRVSERFDPSSLAYPLRSLLFQLVKLAPPTEEYLADLNLAARHLLEHAWQRSPRDGHLAAQAIQLVCQTIAGRPSESATILRRALEPAHLQQYGYQEMFWMAEQIPALAKAAPALARDVYRVAFGFVEERDEQVPFGPGQILPLTQSIKQAYSSSWYSLERAFPEFLQTSPEEATRACLQALEGHVHREHSGGSEQPRSAEFRVGERTARIVEDWSYIWAAGADTHEEALKLLTHLIDHLTELDRDVDRQAELSAIIDVIVEENKLAVVWAALLRAGGRAPRRLGPWLAPLLTARPILTFLDTLTAAGDYLAAMFSSLPVEVRAQIEHAILRITDDATSSDDERAELIRNRLLGCLNDADLVSPSAGLLLADLRAADAVPANEPPFSFTTEWAEYTPERHLREQGVPTDAPANRRLLDLEAPPREFEREYSNRDPTSEATIAIVPQIAALWEAVREAPQLGAHEAQVTHSLAILAAACAAAAKSRDLAEGDRAGALICEVLLFASTHTDPVFDARGAEQFNESQGWGSPAVRIEAAAGLLALARNPNFADPSVQEAIRRLATDEVPPVRYQVACRLTLLYRSAPDLMWELLERFLAEESNRGVLHGALAAAGRLSGAHPDRLVPLLLSALDRVAEGPGADRVREDVSSILFGLAVWQGRADCQVKLDELIDELPRTHDLLSHLVANQRETLTHGPTAPPDMEQDAVRHRGLAFVRSLLSAARTMIEDANAHYGAAGEGLLPEPVAAKVRAAWQVANQIATSFYFASGAYDERRAGEQSSVHEPNMAQRRLYEEGGDILDEIGRLGAAPVVHHLVETLEYFIPIDPGGVFRRIAAAVRAGERGSYPYEHLAVQLIVRITERYLADYRYLFAEDADCRGDLVDLLDAFVRAGWPEARQLTYRLSDIF